MSASSREKRTRPSQTLSALDAKRGCTHQGPTQDGSDFQVESELEVQASDSSTLKIERPQSKDDNEGKFASPHACFEYVQHLVANCSIDDQETLAVALIQEYVRTGSYGDSSLSDLIDLATRGKLMPNAGDVRELLSTRIPHALPPLR